MSDRSYRRLKVMPSMLQTFQSLFYSTAELPSQSFPACSAVDFPVEHSKSHVFFFPVFWLPKKKTPLAFYFCIFSLDNWSSSGWPVLPSTLEYLIVGAIRVLCAIDCSNTGLQSTLIMYTNNVCKSIWTANQTMAEKEIEKFLWILLSCQVNQHSQRQRLLIR